MNNPVVAEQSEQTSEPGVQGPDYEVVVIGAGVGGIYQIKRLIDLGVKATVLEGEDDLGGTWYRNRYVNGSDVVAVGADFDKRRRRGHGKHQLMVALRSNYSSHV